MLERLDLQFQPVPGVADRLEPGLRRILADNPSPMTYWGTNSYILGEGRVTVIDPGPSGGSHLAAILEATRGEEIEQILVTHAHRDHSQLARPLAEISGAPVRAFGPPQAGRSEIMEELARVALIGGGEGVDHGFQPDESIAHATEIETSAGPVTALWTPGHFAGHLSFEWQGRIFSGDHVMGWASTLISPPDGDVTAFIASCAALKKRNAARLYPGHGAPITDPNARIDWLVRHRREREAQILAALGQTPIGLKPLTRRIYHDAPTSLLDAAERNVLAHLIDLDQRGLVLAQPRLGPTASFERA